MRTSFAIFVCFIGVFSFSKVRFKFAVAKTSLSQKAQRMKRDFPKTDINREPDPNVALEGNCVVVCDADVVGVKPQTTVDRSNPHSEPSYRTGNRVDSSKPASPLGSATSFWDKMSSSACGSIVGVGRRERRVAFSVKRSTELATASIGLNGGTTVTFDHVMVNVGNAFDMESSNFVAPVDGIYSISFQVYRLYNKNPLQIDLHVNGRMVLRGFADGDSADHEAAHNGGLLRLNARDRVSVQVSNGNLESGWKYSTFSGHLVFENE